MSMHGLLPTDVLLRAKKLRINNGLRLNKLSRLGNETRTLTNITLGMSMWVSSKIRSDSHTLVSDAFRLFQQADSNIQIREVREHDLVLSVRPPSAHGSESEQLHDCHRVINAMLIALNVGSLGTFTLDEDPWAHPILTIGDDLEGKNSRKAALIVKPETAYPDRQQLTDRDVENSALVFGIVAREKTPVLSGEYLRGLLLMRLNVLELNFRRESFLCFYRALEHFAANRILKVRKLSNELRDLQRAMRTLTDNEELIKELRTVYRIRSSQVAHSQIDQVEISQDDLLKTKVFLDFVMHKRFKAEADAEMLARREAARGV